ncbi:hypothetical protein P20480_0554 [Pseudoalteromonas sp. BSi20480]|nr:hypothetical protein P20480_0554 [Pseudoalteromonas sp. BSi20480]
MAIIFNNGVPTYANEYEFKSDDSCYYLIKAELDISFENCGIKPMLKHRLINFKEK